MSCISTFGTSDLVVMCILWVKPLLVVGLHLVIFIAMLLVVWLFRLHRWLLLIFAWWQICALVPEEIDLYSLWVTCYLIYMLCGGFRALHFWQAGALCLCEIYPSLHFDHWWFLTQTPHHARKTRKCPREGSWHFLGGIWLDWLVLVPHCTIHLYYGFLAWSL